MCREESKALKKAEGAGAADRIQRAENGLIRSMEIFATQVRNRMRKKQGLRDTTELITFDDSMKEKLRLCIKRRVDAAH